MVVFIEQNDNIKFVVLKISRIFAFINPAFSNRIYTIKTFH